MDKINNRERAHKSEESAGSEADEPDDQRNQDIDAAENFCERFILFLPDCPGDNRNQNSDYGETDTLEEKESRDRCCGIQLNDQLESSDDKTDQIRNQRTNENDDFLHR